MRGSDDGGQSSVLMLYQRQRLPHSADRKRRRRKWFVGAMLGRRR